MKECKHCGSLNEDHFNECVSCDESFQKSTQKPTIHEFPKSEISSNTFSGPTVQLNLNKEEKQVLLRIVDNEGFIAKQQRDNLGLFAFSKKREQDEFIDALKEIYITIRIGANDNGPLIFTGELSFTLQAIILAALEYTRHGVGVVTKDTLNTFDKITEQVISQPMFV